jgi:hypothetical protein
MNTTPTIADIIQIIEKHGDWREHQVDSLLSKENHLNVLQENEIRNAMKWTKDAETLQYWGFSYGTVIGLTFASMHRLVSKDSSSTGSPNHAHFTGALDHKCCGF